MEHLHGCLYLYIIIVIILISLIIINLLSYFIIILLVYFTVYHHMPSKSIDLSIQWVCLPTKMFFTDSETPGSESSICNRIAIQSPIQN